MIALVLAALALVVSPQAAMAPATVHARVRVPGDVQATTMVFALTGPDYFQGSERNFYPTGQQQTIFLPDWTHVPSGDYVVVVHLLDRQGHVVAAQQVPVHVLAGLGG